MIESIQIRGGATEFEAAVIAVVVDQLENKTTESPVRNPSSLSPWVMAADPRRPETPLGTIRPE